MAKIQYMNCTHLAQRISALQIQGYKFKAGTVSIRQSAMITGIHWSKKIFFFSYFYCCTRKRFCTKYFSLILCLFCIRLFSFSHHMQMQMQICGDCLQTESILFVPALPVLTHDQERLYLYCREVKTVGFTYNVICQ